MKNTKNKLVKDELDSPQFSDSEGDNIDLQLKDNNSQAIDSKEGKKGVSNIVQTVDDGTTRQFVIFPLELEEVAYETTRLEPTVPLECWHEMRENAIPKVIKREYYYLRIMKRIKPKFMELESWMIFQVDFYAVYESRVIIEPAIVKMAQGYFDMSYFDKALQQAKMLKSNKEHEKVFVRALNTENLKNMQILIDKNGHEYAVERDDPYGDEEDSDLEETKQLIKGKGATAQRIKQRKMLGKVFYANLGICNEG